MPESGRDCITCAIFARQRPGADPKDHAFAQFDWHGSAGLCWGVGVRVGVGVEVVGFDLI